MQSIPDQQVPTTSNVIHNKDDYDELVIYCSDLDYELESENEQMEYDVKANDDDTDNNIINNITADNNNINNDTMTKKNDGDGNDANNDDDADDGIEVIIDDSRIDPDLENISRDEELLRLKHVMDESNVYKQPYVDDLALNAEVQKLVRISINPTKCKYITVKFMDQTILIPQNVEISNILSSMIWAYPKNYTRMVLPSQDEFNRNMDKCRASNKYWPKTYPDGIPFSSKIGIFSAKYKKNIIAADIGLSPLLRTNANKFTPPGSNDEGFKHSSSGVYQYCDFALLIIENGVIIDYAIHGFRSNINECIDVHKPVKIFYNATPGDALDVFMNYPYQPFFPAMNGLMMPIRIYRLPEKFNSISFCERNDVFCALCLALKDFRGLMFRMPHQKITNSYGRVMKPYDRPFKRWHNMGGSFANLAKNQYGQPTHNASPLKLHKAPKSPNRFRSYFKRS